MKGPTCGSFGEQIPARFSFVTFENAATDYCSVRYRGTRWELWGVGVGWGLDGAQNFKPQFSPSGGVPPPLSQNIEPARRREETARQVEQQEPVRVKIWVMAS